MIEHLQNVEEPEWSDQLEYLAQSPVAWLVPFVKCGQLMLKKGTISSNEFLGDQISIFSDLGGILSQDEVGLDKFLVRHVHDVLMNPACTDEESRNRLIGIRAALEDDAHVPNITILRDQVVIVADGNKTAAAYHSLHSGSNDVIDLPVFILDPA